MAVSVKNKLVKELFSLMGDGSSKDRYASILTRLVLYDEVHNPNDHYWRNALMAYLTKGITVKEEVPVVPSPFG